MYVHMHILVLYFAAFLKVQQFLHPSMQLKHLHMILIELELIKPLSRT